MQKRSWRLQHVYKMTWRQNDMSHNPKILEEIIYWGYHLPLLVTTALALPLELNWWFAVRQRFAYSMVEGMWFIRQLIISFGLRFWKGVKFFLRRSRLGWVLCISITGTPTGLTLRTSSWWLPIKCFIGSEVWTGSLWFNEVFTRFHWYSLNGPRRRFF